MWTLLLTEPQIGTVGRQGERGEGVTAKGRAALQTWRLVRMGDEEKGQG